jgi:serine acetyltransferase
MASSVFVASNATVIGDVQIGDSSSIWFGSVVRELREEKVEEMGRLAQHYARPAACAWHRDEYGD